MTARGASKHLLLAGAIVLAATTGTGTAIATSPLHVQGTAPLASTGAFSSSDTVDPPRPSPPGRPRSVDAIPPPTHRPPDGWAVLRRTAGGQPEVATKLLYPANGDRRAFVGAAWFSPSLRFTLVPGSEQPGGAWTTSAMVPDGLRSALVAVFNSGFKFQDLTGGFEAEGRVARPLQDGQASLVIRSDGTASVGEWGRDVRASDQVVAVRQNLRPIVSDGRPVDGLLTLHDLSWGRERWQVQRTPRSGLGQRPDGSLVYVAGPDLDLQQLAEGLVQAGAVRGMELDMHPHMVAFHFFDPPTYGVPGPGPSHDLLDVLATRAGRYLTADTRDFVVVSER